MSNISYKYKIVVDPEDQEPTDYTIENSFVWEYDLLNKAYVQSDTNRSLAVRRKGLNGEPLYVDVYMGVYRMNLEGTWIFIDDPEVAFIISLISNKIVKGGDRVRVQA